MDSRDRVSSGIVNKALIDPKAAHENTGGGANAEGRHTPGCGCTACGGESGEYRPQPPFHDRLKRVGFQPPPQDAIHGPGQHTSYDVPKRTDRKYSNTRKIG
jgi:hypothetical protein